MIGIYYLRSLKEWDFNFVTTQRKSTATCQRVEESWTFGCGARQPREAASAAPWRSWQDGFVPLRFTFSFRRKWTLFREMLCLHMSNSQNKTQHFPQVSDDRIMKSRSNESLLQVSYQVLLLYQCSFLSDYSGRLQLLIRSRTNPYDPEAISAYPQRPPLLLPPLYSLLIVWIHRTQTCSSLTMQCHLGWHPSIAQGCRGASIPSTIMCLFRATLLVYSPCTLTGNCFRVALRVKYVTFT